MNAATSLRRLALAIPFAALALLASRPAAAAEHRLGIGAHYWRTVDQVVDDRGEIDDSGLSWLVSYQYVPSLLRFELDLEVFPQGFGGSTDTAYSPQAYVLLGAGLYGGLGVGVTTSNFDGGSVSDPYWAARAGFDRQIVPGVHLDINANYRFHAWSELEGADTDTVTLGAIARVAF